MSAKRKRDVERTYPKQQILAKLRRLVDSVEKNRRFAIQVHGERIYVPAGAVLSIEHERGNEQEEIEIQLKWNRSKRAARET
jgi:amphi-Trp domain-containing protein